MFWNKKESKDGLPDLPPLKNPLRPVFDTPLRENQEEKVDDEPEEPHNLPSFPDSPMQKGFSQTVIKEAISQESIPEENNLPIVSSSIKTTELDSVPVQKQKFVLEEPPTEKPASIPYQKKPIQKPNETFVKVEKFNSAHRTLTSIRKKVDDLDNALRKIREVKLREEQELSSWEKEVASLKTRLQEVNDSLFE